MENQLSFRILNQAGPEHIRKRAQRSFALFREQLDEEAELEFYTVAGMTPDLARDGRSLYI